MFDANLLAKRCVDAGDDLQEWVFFFQSLVLAAERKSPGTGAHAIPNFVKELRKAFPDAIAITALRTVQPDKDGFYNAEQVRILRAEIGRLGREIFPLKGEQTPREEMAESDEKVLSDILDRGYEYARPSRPAHPNGYSKKDFEAIVELAYSDLPEELVRLCLEQNREAMTRRLWHWKTAYPALKQFIAQTLKSRRAAAADTANLRLTFEALDECLATSGLVIIQGDDSTGKTFAAETWCECNPSAARYIETPAVNTDLAFFLEIADRVGVYATPNSELRRVQSLVEDAVLRNKKMLVFDVCRNLFPATAKTHPRRIAWILERCVKAQIPVALIVSPRFWEGEKSRNNNWNISQLLSEVYRHFRYTPIETKDILLIARHLLPECDGDDIRAVATYIQKVAPGSLKGFNAILNRVKYIAKPGDSGPRDISSALADLRTTIASTAIAQVQPRCNTVARGAEPPVPRASDGEVEDPKTNGNRLMISGFKSPETQVASY